MEVWKSLFVDQGVQPSPVVRQGEPDQPGDDEPRGASGLPQVLKLNLFFEKVNKVILVPKRSDEFSQIKIFTLNFEEDKTFHLIILMYKFNPYPTLII